LKKAEETRRRGAGEKRAALELSGAGEAGGDKAIPRSKI